MRISGNCEQEAIVVESCTFDSCHCAAEKWVVTGIIVQPCVPSRLILIEGVAPPEKGARPKAQLSATVLSRRCWMGTGVLKMPWGKNPVLFPRRSLVLPKANEGFLDAWAPAETSPSRLSMDPPPTTNKHLYLLTIPFPFLPKKKRRTIQKRNNIAQNLPWHSLDAPAPKVPRHLPLHQPPHTITANQTVLRHRNKVPYSAMIILVIAAGLASRSRFSVHLSSFIAEYGGDTLWALIVFLLVGFCFPALPTSIVAMAALGFSFTVEVSQLYQGEWLNEIRRTRPGALVLGTGFVGSDFLCYTTGVIIGVAGEFLCLGRRGNRSLEASSS